MRFKTLSGEFRWYRMSVCISAAEGEAGQSVVGTLTDADEKIRLREKLHRLAQHDEITGIYNKQAFYAQTERLLGTGSEQQYSLLLFDVNRFKMVNELFGIKEVDRVLRFIAKAAAALHWNLPHKEFRSADQHYGGSGISCPANGQGQCGGQFQVYYQTKHRTESGGMIGAEALVRWIHPEKGLIPPVEFIGLFERNGLITMIDEMCGKGYAKTCGTGWTGDSDRFLTLAELEGLWGKLIGDTNVVYSNMVQHLLENIDEKDVVRKKS